MLTYSFIGSLNSSLFNQRIKFKFPWKNSIIIRILNILINEGLIEGYRVENLFPIDKQNKNKNFYLKNKQGLIVFFRMHKGRYNSLKAVVNVSRPSWRKSVTFYELSAIQFKNPSAIFLISTDRGFMSSREALNLKIGGFLLFRFN